MSNSAKMAVLNSHERACWNALQEHLLTCTMCWQAFENRDMANNACLAGTASFEEWCITDRRCSEQLAIEKVQGVPERD
mgnify:CR=1 FL=1